VESSLREFHDPEIDGPRGLKPWKIPMPRAAWLVAGVAVMSLACVVLLLSLFLRSEGLRRPPAQRSNDRDGSPGPVAAPPGTTARPFAPRPLFERIPASIREKGLPTSEVSLAAEVRSAEGRGGDALRQSHNETGVHPKPAQTSASEALKPHLAPGRKIDGWLMQVHWSILREGGGSSRYSYSGVPPVYEMSLRFPEDLAGYEISLWGHNYDFWSKEFTCPNPKFESIKEGDWVRVFGVLRPGSRIEWLPTKSDELLSLGEMTITDIQGAGVGQE
jgi:hypothetical protein